MTIKCSNCPIDYGDFKLVDDKWLCRYCYLVPAQDIPYLKEVGIENPADPEGSTAHVRDIKARRWDPVEKRLFYHQAPKSYFFGKG